MIRHTIKWLLLVTLVGAGPLAHAKVFVFACEPIYKALAEQLGGDEVEAFSATTGLQDPHHIQARPSLIAKIRRADMVACHGAELEIGWLPLLLRRASNPKLNPGRPGYFIGTEHIRILGKPKQVDRSQGDVHASGNPHLQTSPANIARVARAMSAALVQIDPAHADLYQSRLEQFSAKWKVALKRWKKMTRPLRHLPIVVHHESWIYLEDYLKLEKLGTLEDKPGVPPTSGHLSELLEAMKRRPAKVIIYAAYQDDRAARWLSKRTGIPAVKVPFTIGGTPEAKDLFSLYDDTFKRLLDAVAAQ